MTQPEPTTPATASAQEPTTPAVEPAPKDDPDAGTDWKAEARKWEQRAKENQTAKIAADAERKKSMTDAERALSEAEERGRTSAATEFGRDLARERFDALAGRRNPAVNTSQVLEFVDLGKFLDDSGRPDNKAIESAVKRLVPEPAGPPSFEGGTRQSAPAGKSMSQMIRESAGR